MVFFLLTAFDSAPPPVTATLLLRALCYDRNLPSRSHKIVTIAVLYQQGRVESETEKTDLVVALKDASTRFNVSGLPIRVVEIPYSSPQQLGTLLKAENVSSIFLCTGLADDLAAISKAAQQYHTLSFTGTEAYLKLGVSIAIIRRGSHPAIMVNLTEARAEGADLESAFLSVAEVSR